MSAPLALRRRRLPAERGSPGRADAQISDEPIGLRNLPRESSA
jgi:hypothetical protein